VNRVLTKENTVLAKVNTVLTKVNTVLTKENTVLTKVNTVLTKVNTVLTKENTVLTKVSTEKGKVSAVTQFHIKGAWPSGRVLDCNPEGRGIESAGATFDDSFVGKLSENSFAGEQKTVGKFRLFRNIPSSSSELVGLTRSSC
jgi:hypothetical protein